MKSKIKVQMDGTDDYLHQAADSANWPKGIKYDPNNKGTYIASLWVHKHCNNETDKEYSKNLGTGNGIELGRADIITSVTEKHPNPEDFILYANYSNPINPLATIKYFLSAQTYVLLKILDITGREISTLVNAQQSAGYHKVNYNVQDLSSGVYLYQLRVGKFEMTRKLILQK